MSLKMGDAAEQKLFHPSSESIEEFLSRFNFQNYKRLKDAKDDDKEKASLLGSCLPRQVITQIQQKLRPKILEEATYAELQEQLKAVFSTKKSTIGASVSFIRRKQLDGESIEAYSMALNDLGSQCKYNECCRSRLLRDQFIAGLRSTKLIRTLITSCENESFETTVERAKQHEQISADAEDILPENRNARVFANKPQHRPSYNRNTFKKTFRKDVDRATNINNEYICIRCTAKGKHLAKECFALQMKCNKCQKKGHLAKACRSREYRNDRNDRNRANHIDDDSDSDVPPEEFNQCNWVSVKQLRQRKTRSSETHSGLATTNRFGGLHDVEDVNNEWPSIEEQGHYYYNKNSNTFKRKDNKKTQPKPNDFDKTGAKARVVHGAPRGPIKGQRSIVTTKVNAATYSVNSGRQGNNPFLGRHASTNPVSR